MHPGARAGGASLVTVSQGRSLLDCSSSPEHQYKASSLETKLQEKAECEAESPPTVRSGSKWFVSFRQGLWCLQGGDFLQGTAGAGWASCLAETVLSYQQ